ncbi:SWPV1-100 [Shearwaterpox virus]|uniref:SWPV1-100 n=1 Tax=Shearwaterpox virus TaxID=1974596 RepID=A0A1V0S7U6_CNPV|nr:SWPV1-100 [Shearwaterpox virus]
MDNFIKQISCKIVKPAAELEPPESKMQYYYMNISFNFPDLYYCNKNLFAKPENTLLDISKSLLMLNSFPYESFVIHDLIITIRRYVHIYDVYFSPVGWFVGKGSLPNYHVCIRLIRSANQDIIDNIVRKYLIQHGIYGDNLSIELETENEIFVNRHSIIGARQLQPICIVSFYPFDPENKLLFVIYIGRYNDRYCGVSYIVNREDMYDAMKRIYSYVACIYLVSDDIVTFHITPLASHDGKKLKQLPINYCNTLCEIVYEFEYLRFEQSTMPIPVFTPFIPKQLVNIINLPDDTPITCSSINRLEYVTHIDNKKLKRILVIIKDKFLKNTILHGTFKKKNIVRNKKYTFTITWSTFDCPTLGNIKSSSPNTCERVVLDGSRYVTKTFNDTI